MILKPLKRLAITLLGSMFVMGTTAHADATFDKIYPLFNDLNGSIIEEEIMDVLLDGDEPLLHDLDYQFHSVTKTIPIAKTKVDDYHIFFVGELTTPNSEERKQYGSGYYMAIGAHIFDGQGNYIKKEGHLCEVRAWNIFAESRDCAIFQDGNQFRFEHTHEARFGTYYREYVDKAYNFTQGRFKYLGVVDDPEI